MVSEKQLFNQCLEYITTIQNIEKKRYAQEVIELLKLPGRRVAYHAFCTDGSVSAALLKKAGEGDVFIPLDYWLINHEIFSQLLEQLEWYAIIDLMPFNKKYPVDLFVDHHVSNIPLPKLARRIHFECGKSGPSAAWVFWNAMAKQTQLPNYLYILAEMTRITDTASYKIDAPVSLYTEKKIITEPQEVGSELYHELIWDLQDGCNLSVQIASTNNTLVDLLSEKGLQSLLANKEVIDRINIYRKQRAKALNFAKDIKPTSLTIIRNPNGRNIQDTIINWLLKNGAKVAIAIKEDNALKQCSISFRQSKLNTS